MEALLVLSRNPLTPVQPGDFRILQESRSLAELAPVIDLPVICQINDRYVLRKNWGTVYARHGDIVAFKTLPQGGNGDSGKALRTVALIVISIYAPSAGASLAKSWGITSTLGAALVTAGVFYAGAALVNLMLPLPKQPSALSAAEAAAASPTYSLQSQGNYARLGSAVPVQYGRMQAFPDFAAQPYAEFSSNEQFLYQLLCVGIGEYDIEQINFEDTPIESYGDDVQYEIVNPGETSTIFPQAVVNCAEVAGQEALTGVYVGPFTVNAAGTEITAVGWDVFCPRGLFKANNDGSYSAKSVVFLIEVQQIDDSGTPTGLWLSLAGTPYTITSNTTTPQRVSGRSDVPRGRYQVRFLRQDTKDTSPTAGHDLNWSGFRGFLPDDNDYGDVTLLAMRIRASATLSSSVSRRVNVIATRKLKYWDVDSWSVNALPTSSIAYALADVCREVYGLGLTNNMFNVDQLLALQETWTERGDSFNGRFDNFVSAWEVLQQIARVGRAKPYIQSGIINFVRDEPKDFVSSMFTSRNTVKGSLTIQYLTPTEQSADAVEVEYIDQRTWKPTKVISSLPGSTRQNIASVKLFGVTDHAQAWREGMYMAACNVYRRKSIDLSTEMEGMIPTYGDLVAVGYDRLTAAQTGEVLSYDPVSLVLTVDQDVSFSDSEANYVLLRGRDGAPQGPYVVHAGGSKEIVFNENQDVVVDTGLDRERTTYTFGTQSTYTQLGLVTSVAPGSGTQVQIGIVAEYVDVDNVALIHTADTGTPPDPLDIRDLPGLVRTPDPVTGITLQTTLIQIGNNVRNRLDVSWSPSNGAEGYRFAWRIGTESNWTTFPDQQGTVVSVLDIPEEQIQVRVIAFKALLESVPSFELGTIYGKTARPGPVTGFTLIKSAGFGLAEWLLHADLDVRIGGKIVIRYTSLDSGATWRDGIIVGSYPGNAVSGTVPLMSGTYMVKAQDSSGGWSEDIDSWVIEKGTVDDFVMVDSILESPAFTGFKDNVAVADGKLRLDSASTVSEMTTPVSEWPKISSLGGIAGTGLYEFSDLIDFGTLAVRRLETNINGFSFDTGDFISFRGLVSGWDTVTGSDVDDCDATLYVRTTPDDPYDSDAVWSERVPFFVADFNCRGVQFELELVSGSPTHNIEIDLLGVEGKVLA